MKFCLEFASNAKEISFLKPPVSSESQKHIQDGGFPKYSWSNPSSVFTQFQHLEWLGTLGSERSSSPPGVCPELAGKQGSEKTWDLGIT